jgi:hypothetical protein
MTELPVDSFHLRSVKGRQYPYHCCKPCRSAKPRTIDPLDKEKWIANRKAKGLKRKPYDRTLDPARWVFTDCKGSDKKKEREFDLTYAFVKAEINKPCSYCYSTGHQMTLDRKDNTLGHVMSNVVPSCYRCNMFRRDMPYEAWLIMAITMREVADRGLLGDWGLTPIRRGKMAREKGI